MKQTAFLTILRCQRGYSAAKRFTPDAVKSFNAGTWFDWQEHQISGFDDLARLLTRQGTRPDELVVLGKVADDHRDDTRIRRWKNARGGKTPYLTDTGSRVLHLDIDDLPCPAGTGWHNPEEMARRVWGLIENEQPAMRGASFCWQASNSAGTPGKAGLAKLHLWALLDRPIGEDRRRELLGELAKVHLADPAMASINQPNYTAAPIFEGVPDPLTGRARSGIVRGNLDEIPTAQIRFPEKAIAERKARKANAHRIEIPTTLAGETSEYGQRLLDRACGEISALPSGGRNVQINRIAFRIGGYAGAGLISPHDALSALLSAGKASGHARYHEAVNNGFRDGLARPFTPPDTPPPGGPKAAKPRPIDPVHKGADSSLTRQEQVDRARNVLRSWDRQSTRMIRATKEVERIEAEELPETAKADVKKKRATIRANIKQKYQLPTPPNAKWSKHWTGPRDMLTGAQGIGKTAEFVGTPQRNGRPSKPGLLHSGTGFTTLFLAPNHGNNSENAERYLATMPVDRPAPPAFQLRGRSAARPNDANKTMCALATQAQKLAKRGGNVMKAMCSDCRFADECRESGYLAQQTKLEQAKTDPRGIVIFAPHDYAVAHLPGGIVPDRVIFDEAPRDSFMRTAAVPVEDWQQDLRQYLGWERGKEGQASDALSDLIGVINPLRTALARAIDDPSNGLEIIETRAREIARGSEGPADVLTRAANAMTSFLDDALESAISAAMTDDNAALSPMRKKGDTLEKRLDKILDSGAETYGRRMAEIFKAVAAEARNGTGPGLVAVDRRPENGRDCIVADYLAKPETIPEHAPFLHIDGTGRAELAAAWFGELRHHHCPVERLGKATLVTGNSFATSNITGENSKGTPLSADRAKVLRGKLQEGLAAHPNAAVVAPKKAIPSIKGLEGRTVMHFGNLRGKNDAEAAPEIIVIGRNLPKPSDLERIGRAFAVSLGLGFACLPAGTKYPTRDEGVRMKDGAGHRVEVQYHPDPTAQALLRQIRDAEATQAVDRVRAHFTAKQIYVLGNSIPDVTFDRIEPLADWHKGGSKLTRAVARSRVAMRSPAEILRAFPDIWANKDAVKNDMEFQDFRDADVARQLGGKTYIVDPLYTLSPPNSPAVLVEYRRPRREGPGAPPGLAEAVVLASPENARAVLEELTGPLASFEIKEMNEAAIEAEARIMRAAMEAAEAPEHHDDAQDDTAAQAADGRVVALNTRTTPSEPAPRQAATAGGISFWIEPPGEPPG